jgi:aspartokinase/homoserine dehydrogenase 1
MRILKFGGTSVGSPDAINEVLGIIRQKQEEGEPAVVVSAFKGVTDLLLESSRDAASGKEDYQEILKQIEQKHQQIVKQLIDVQRQSEVLAKFKMMLNELEDVLQGVFLVREATPRTMDFILGFGERFSAYILSRCLSNSGIPSDYTDARPLIKTDDHFGTARVLMEPTTKNIRDHFGTADLLQVVTGFIGSTRSGESTTLGRGGSDYTASLLGAALEADAIEIWTDVDGLMTADPRKVDRAFSIGGVSFEEAMELSHFGAKVIYPPTMKPAMRSDIPILIFNTFNPDQHGTKISRLSGTDENGIKGISSIDEIALITIKGSGMVGVTGIASRIFDALAAHEINIILITQASSEHTVSLAVMPQQAPAAKNAIEKAFKAEIIEKDIDRIEVQRDLSIVAVVGDHMQHTPGIAGRVFSALGRNGINIVAIAQGSSERNISFVIPKKDESKAINTLHDAFFLAGVKTVNLFLVGTGLIGGKLLELIEKQRQTLRDDYLIDIHLTGVTNSRKMLSDPQGIDLDTWQQALEKEGAEANMDRFIDEIENFNLPNSIFVDCSASQTISDVYERVLSSSISVVAANKRANSGKQAYFETLKQQSMKRNVSYRYETNVGAGLPVLYTLGELVTTGDEVKKIEGVLSGTLSYIFNRFTGDASFSEIVREAREKGYTEPDPREDLNGNDVGRKLLILAREAGYNLEFEDLEIQNLVPEQLRELSEVDVFLEGLEEYDSTFEQLRLDAEEEGKKLCYIARFEQGEGSIKLEEIGPDHPFYNLSGSDNMVAFTTRHYHTNPMVIRGPGAGPNVTASGVIADILRTADTSAASNG